MVTPFHDKDGFFKYYTADAAKLTLEKATRRWTTPILFNDPFDNQFELNFEEPSEIKALSNLKGLLDSIASPEPVTTSQFGSIAPFVEMLRQANLQNTDFQITEGEMAYLHEGAIEGMSRVVELMPEVNAEMRRILADTAILCLSETPDNLLMWSHYAQNHTGVVVKFLSLSNVDSPLMLARPVRYTNHMPRLGFESLMNFEVLRGAIFDTITLTKGQVWAYEKEWRVIATLRDKCQCFEILPFAREEVGAVYLGCNMASDAKGEIIDVTRRTYVKAKIYQAERDRAKFALNFREVG
jgi:hypothetical protein